MGTGANWGADTTGHAPLTFFGGVMSDNRADRTERWAGPAAGLVGAIVTMTGLGISDIAGPEAISPHASGDTIARVLADNKDRFQLGTTILMIGLFFLVWFLVHLQTRLNPNGTTRWMASVASVGGLITVTLMALVVSYVRASVETKFSGSDVVIPKAIVLFDWNYWRTWAPFVSAHMLASGIAIIRTSLLPKFLGWGAVAVAFVPLVLPPGIMTIVFMLWMVILSAGLLIKGIRDAPPDASSPPRPTTE